jgi:hypothetical protein
MATSTKNEIDLRGNELRAAAETFVTSIEASVAIQKVATSRQAFAAAQKDPEGFFASHGARLPPGLALELFKHPPRLPRPELSPFILEFYNCRTIWVRERDDTSVSGRCTFREQTICFGWRVRPRFPFPWPSA